MMRHFLIAIFSLTLGTSFSQDVQLPLDLVGKLYVLDANTEKKINIFPEYEEFVSARVFQTADSVIYLEIEYREGEQNFREKRELTLDELRELQKTISSRVNAEAPELTYDHRGRQAYILSSSILGLTFYGGAVPVVLDPIDDRVGIAMYMLTAGGTIFFSTITTKYRDITRQAANAKIYGQVRGAVDGALLMGTFSNNADERLYLGGSLITSMAAGKLYFLLTNHYKWDGGQIGIMNTMGDFGYGYSAALADYMNLFNNYNTQAINGMLIAGNIGGMFLGDYLNKEDHYTYGDSQLIRSGGLLGAYTGVTLSAIMNVENSKGVFALALAGNAVGVIYGHQLAKKHDLSNSEGIFMNLGTLGGALTGLGLAYLTSSDGSNNYKYLLGATAVGGLGGFAITKNALIKRSRIRKERQATLDYDINPLAFSGKVNNQRKFNPNTFVPAFSLRLKF